MTVNISAEVEIEIPFHDVDLMEITWHGHYVKYMEIARCKLLDKIDYNYAQMLESGYGWPVIDMRVRYANPAKYQQKIIVSAAIDEWENRLRIKYVIRDLETGRRLTKAYTDQVAVDMESGEMLYASPQILLDKLGLIEE